MKVPQRPSHLTSMGANQAPPPLLRRNRQRYEQKIVFVSPCICLDHNLGSSSRCVDLFSTQVFRKDLISAMKLPDSHHVSSEDYYLLADTWKQEWEKGVQVTASPDTIPQSSVRYDARFHYRALFIYPQCHSPANGCVVFMRS